jgi:hypothetical protein
MINRRNIHSRPGIPLFFKLWFAFVALLALSIIGGVAYVLVSVASHGPEGLGREVGHFLRGIKEGQR